jgi:hypothetical protein
MHGPLFAVVLVVVVLAFIFWLQWSGKRMEKKFEQAFSDATKKAEQEVDDRVLEQIERQDAEDKAFKARAKRYPATVMAAKQIGSMNARPLLRLHLNIAAPDGAYELDLEHAPDAQDAHRYASGCAIEVDVDPADRQLVKCV